MIPPCLPRAFQVGGIGFGGRVGQPQPIPRSIRARRSATLPSRLIFPSRRLPAHSYCIGETPDGPVDLPGSRPSGRITQGASVIATRTTPSREPRSAWRTGWRATMRPARLGVLDLSVQVGQQRQVGGQDPPGDRARRGSAARLERRSPDVRPPARRSWTSRAAANRISRFTPRAVSRAGSANSAATSRPILVPNTSGNASVNPGNARSS